MDQQDRDIPGPTAIASAGARRRLLGEMRRGFTGIVQGIDAAAARSALEEAELERRLLELGFLEGVRVEVLHEGMIARDPIAVRVDDVTVAIRRREAMAIVLAE